MASAVRWLSPVIMAVWSPIPCSSRMASTESSFSVSATATTPARVPLIATNMAVLASFSSRTSSASRGAGSKPCSPNSRREPTSTRSASTEAITPLPRTAWKSCGSHSISPCASAFSTMARPSGCSLPRSAEAARRNSAASSKDTSPGRGSSGGSAPSPRLNSDAPAPTPAATAISGLGICDLTGEVSTWRLTTTSVTSGLPLVMVPVLSKMTILTSLNV